MEIEKNLLFQGIEPDRVKELIELMDGNIKKYSKGEVIYESGNYINKFAIVISGEVLIERYDENGNRVIFSKIEEGGHFGDSYVFLKEIPIMIDVVAGKDTEVLFIDILKLYEIKLEDNRILLNITKILAKKNVVLSKKIIHSSSKTIRGKITSYLREQRIMNKSKKFKIKYNRQILSEYLNCDRSQLSKELSKMKKEGIIDFNKDFFIIKKDF